MIDWDNYNTDENGKLYYDILKVFFAYEVVWIRSDIEWEEVDATS